MLPRRVVRFHSCLAAIYKIKLIDPLGEESVMGCPDDKFILEEALDAGIDLPYSCQAGTCSSCVAKLKEGLVDQDEQMSLDDDQVEEGWILTCVAYPKSDCVILTDQQDNLFG